MPSHTRFRRTAEVPSEGRSTPRRPGPDETPKSRDLDGHRTARRPPLDPRHQRRTGVGAVPGISRRVRQPDGGRSPDRHPTAVHRIGGHLLERGRAVGAQCDRHDQSRSAPRPRRPLLWHHRQRAGLVRSRDREGRQRVPVRAHRGQSREQRPQREHQRLLRLPAEPAARPRRHLRAPVLRGRPRRGTARAVHHDFPEHHLPRFDVELCGGHAASRLDGTGDRRGGGEQHPVGRGRHAQALPLGGRVRLRLRTGAHEHAARQARRPRAHRPRAPVPAHPPDRDPCRLRHRRARHVFAGLHRRR